MPASCIGVADDSDEGREIASALRARGFVVEEVELSQITAGFDVDLLILAGDVPGALDMLTSTRGAADTAIIPIILVGAPPDLDDPRPSRVLSLGADAHYNRPVPIDRLLRKIETYLSPPELRLSAPPKLETEPEVGREPTIQLDASKTTWSLSQPDDAQTPHEASYGDVSLSDMDLSDMELPDEVQEVSVADARPSSPPVGPRTGQRSETTSVSPRLEKLLADADRRVFTDREALQIGFPAASQSARQLVPDDLLENVSLPVEPAPEDPLEAFTYVWAAPESLEVSVEAGNPLGAASFQRTSPTSKQFSVPAHVDETQLPPPDAEPASFYDAFPTGPFRREQAPRQRDVLPSIGEAMTKERGRHGELGPGDAIRALLAFAQLRSAATLQLTPIDGAAISLRAEAGVLTRLDGPIALRTLMELARDGRAEESASDEAGAVSALERRVAAGLLSRFELDRRLRRARESTLRDAVATSAGRFELTLMDTRRQHAPLFARPLSALVVEACRQRLGADALRRLVGADRLVLRLQDSAAERFAQAELEPELVSLLERHDNQSLSTLLSAAPEEEGVAGTVYALVCWDAARLDAGASAAGNREDLRGAARNLIEAAAELAEDGHYFAILGVEVEAKPRELSQAYQDRRQELERVDLSGLGLTRLETARSAALNAVEEAWEVLRRENWRQAYRQALSL